MTDEAGAERADLVIDILRKIQGDIALVRREQQSQSLRLLAMEDHQRGIITSLHGVVTSIHGVDVNLAAINGGLHRIENRLGLKDTEH